MYVKSEGANAKYMKNPKAQYIKIQKGLGNTIKIVQYKFVNNMFQWYIMRYVSRVSIFLLTLYLYIFYHNQAWQILNQPIIWKVAPLHLIWGVYMITMFWHLFANWRITMGGKKAHLEYYKEDAKYDKIKLFEFVKDQNYKAWIIALVWVTITVTFGMLYLFGVIAELDLFMLTVFYYLCDMTCMLFFCPFQHYMKNRCCVNCRIFDWGHFMMFTPMVFIKNFFSWTLFIVSIVVLIRWELTYARNPERFWSGSNETLRCENCQDKLCEIKHPYINKNKLNKKISV